MMHVDEKVAALKVGDKFYSSHSSCFYPMVVASISPSGIITAHYENNSSGINKKFNPDGRERGSSGYGYWSRPHIDTAMTFSERTRWVGAKERTHKAVDKFFSLEEDVRKHVGRNADKESLLKAVQWLREQFFIIEQAVADI